MTSLTEPTDIANWLLASVSVLAAGIGAVNALVRGSKPIQEHSLSAAFISFVTMVMSITLIINQGIVTREDGVNSTYARWAYMILINAIFGSQVASALGTTGIPKKATCLSLALAGAAFLLSSISSDVRVWPYYALSIALTVIFGFCVICYPTGGDGSSSKVEEQNPKKGVIILKTVAIALVAVYPVMFALGHATTGVISFLSETWVYVSLDIAKIGFSLFLAYFWAEKAPKGERLD